MTEAKRRFGVRLAVVFVALCAAGGAAHAQSHLTQDYALEINVTSSWTATGIMLTEGQPVIVRAKGLFGIGNFSPPGSWRGMLGANGSHESATGVFPAPDVNCYRAIAKIGPDGDPFALGDFWAFQADSEGELYLGINDENPPDNHGHLYCYLWLGVGGSQAVPPPSTSDDTVSSALTLRSSNPFVGESRLSYRVHDEGPVQIIVYDSEGRKLRTLENRTQSAGLYDATWDGRDETGSAMPAGTYYVRVRTDRYSATRKVTLVR